VAKRTLTVIILTLIVLLLGIAYLVRAYGITATEPGGAGYQSLLSMLLAAVAGRGAFYYVSIASILAVLALSANTAFADFPRLCRAIAQNGYLPRSFSVPGRRLVYSHGIYALAALSGFLLVVFGGVTDRLIPLFAVGAFLAFTLSQAGMVAHWRRVGGPTARRSMAVNGLGALVTGLTVAVILVAKFLEGAWLTLLLIPVLVGLMLAVRRHYYWVALEVRCLAPLDFAEVHAPIVVVPVSKWGEIARKALSFAVGISDDVRAVHVDAGEDTTALRSEWAALVEEPADRAGVRRPKLVVLSSPYRAVILPIVEFVHQVEHDSPGRQVAGVIPELVEQRWYHHVLHNKRAALLKAWLLMRGTPRTVVVNVPWYLGRRETGHSGIEHGVRRLHETGRLMRQGP
jgi:hypothetical protein